MNFDEKINLVCWRMLKSGAEIWYWSIFYSWFSYSLHEYAKHGSHFWSCQNCSRSSQFALSLKFNFQWCSWWFVELANNIASLWLWSNVGFFLTQWGLWPILKIRFQIDLLFLWSQQIFNAFVWLQRGFGITWRKGWKWNDKKFSLKTKFSIIEIKMNEKNQKSSLLKTYRNRF